MRQARIQISGTAYGRLAWKGQYDFAGDKVKDVWVSHFHTVAFDNHDKLHITRMLGVPPHATPGRNQRWIDNFAIAHDAPHPCTAHTFINWMYTADNGGVTCTADVRAYAPALAAG